MLTLKLDLGWRPLNLTELAHPYSNSELNSRFGCSHVADLASGAPAVSYTIMGNALYSLPMGLTAVDPTWESCTVMVAAQDPPRSLTRALAMVGPTTTPAAADPTVKPAAGIIAPAAPTSTAVMVPLPVNDPADPTASTMGVVDPMGLSPSKIDPGKSSKTMAVPEAGPSSSVKASPPTNPTAGDEGHGSETVESDPKTGQGVAEDPAADPKLNTQSTSIAASNPSDPQTTHIAQQPNAGPNAPDKPAAVPAAAPANSEMASQQSTPPSSDNQKSGDQGSEASNQGQAHQDTDEIASHEAKPPVVIGDQTFAPGPTPVTVAGTVHSIAAPDGNIVIGDSTVVPPPNPVISSAPSPPPQLFSIGSQAVSYTMQSDEIIISSQTLRAGSPIVIAASHTLALNPSAGHNAIFVDGEPTVIPKSDASSGEPHLDSPPFTVAGHTISTDNVGNYVYQSQTLKHGGPAITISGTPISLAPASQITVGGSIIPLTPVPTAVPSVVVGGHSLTTDSAGDYKLGTNVIQAGSPAVTISNSPISLDQAGSHIVVGSSTINIAPHSTQKAEIQIGDHAVPYSTDSASNLVIGSKTLTPGGPAITITNTPISYGASASQLVVGSSTIDLAPHSTPKAEIQIGDHAVPYSTDSASKLIFGSKTLTPGAPAITISGVPISLEPSASQIVVGSSTLTLHPVATSEKPLVIGSQIVSYSLNSASDVIIAGSQTLVPGGAAITISSNVISAIKGSGTSGPEVIVGQGSSKTTEGLGNMIMNGFGTETSLPTGSAGVGSSAPSASATGFQGGAARRATHGVWVLVVPLFMGLVYMQV